MKHYTRTRPRGDNYSHSLAITRPETASEVTHWPGPAWPGPHWQSAATYTRAIYYNQHEGSTATNTGTAYSATPSLAAAQSGTEHLPNINPARLHCSFGGGSRAQPATLTVRHSASTEHRHSAATEHQPGPTPLPLWRRRRGHLGNATTSSRHWQVPCRQIDCMKILTYININRHDRHAHTFSVLDRHAHTFRATFHTIPLSDKSSEFIRRRIHGHLRSRVSARDYPLARKRIHHVA